jgi:Glycogen debranching enzyme N terminal/Amylo-alpha-1,6-glucosidase
MGLGQDVLSRLPRAIACEWWLANGVGGAAAGTAPGANPRSIHAHLASPDAAGTLIAALLRIDERATSPEGTFELGCQLQSNGMARPAGHRLLESFAVDPWPTWRYRLESSRIEKTLMLVYERHAVVVSYRLLEGPPLRLHAGPVLVSRPLAAPLPTANGNEGWGSDEDDSEEPGPESEPQIQGIPGRVRIRLAAEGPPLTLWHNGAFMPARAWTRVRYVDGTFERAFLPGHVEGPLTADQPLHLVAATEEALFRTLAQEARLGAVPPRTLDECVVALERDERDRLELWGRAADDGARATATEAARARKRGDEVAPESEITRVLSRALDAGLWRREGRLGFASTLPPLVERGSDALRAVTGLIAVRAFEPAREILRGYVEYLSEGLAPEYFEPDGTPIYGDAEPSLWLVIAGERCARRSGDTEFAKDVLFPALEEVMRYYRSGAPGGIRVDEDGLLVTHEADAEGVPHPVKRAGLNALWSQAYIAMAGLARAAGRREIAAFYLAWAQDHQKRFVELFWDAKRSRLYDRLRNDEPVRGIGPDHTWAVALSPALLPAERAPKVVKALEAELAAPFGLRSARDADRASSAWLGPWLSATVRAAGRSAESLSAAREHLIALTDWMAGEGAGGIPAAWRAGEHPLADWTLGMSPLAAAELVRFWVEDCEHALVEARAPEAH